MAFGFLGAFLFTVVKDFLPSALAKSDQVITANAFQLVDANGKLRAQLAFSKQGPPAFWLMDERGVARVTFGLYEDGTGYIGLQDKDGQMIELMRSFGPKEAPLLIFKNAGRDMMITGLNPTADPVPFTMYYDKARQRKVQFGQYDGP